MANSIPLAVRGGRWPADLGKPIDPQETQDRIRAQSILTGSLIGGVCPTLTIEQARDVLAWYSPLEAI